MTGPKLLFLDIETAPILMTSWSQRPPYAGAVYVVRDTYILMVSYKWADDRTVKTVALPDFPRYKRHRHDDKDLCGVLHRLMDEADIICAHNGDAFDIKKINSRLITNGFSPPSPFKTIDTLKAARRACKQDTELLARVYERVKPWMVNHPNMNLYRAIRDRPPGLPCPTCESTNTQRRGIIVKINSRRQRFQCRECGSWFSGGKV